MSDHDGTITLTIHEYMDYGLSVFDVNSTKVGTVDEYDRTTGYMKVRPHPLSDRRLHIPFNAITHIDPREVFVSSTREEAHRLFRDPPPRSTLVEERLDPITGEDDSEALTTEPSGYDGVPAVVDDVAVGKLAHHIAPGFRVLSSEGEDLGTVAHYDRTIGQMLIRSGRGSRSAFAVPIAFLDFVDREDRAIYLSVSAADLARHPTVELDNPESHEEVVEPEVTEP